MKVMRRVGRCRTTAKKTQKMESEFTNFKEGVTNKTLGPGKMGEALVSGTAQEGVEAGRPWR